MNGIDRISIPFYSTQLVDEHFPLIFRSLPPTSCLVDEFRNKFKKIKKIKSKMSMNQAQAQSSTHKDVEGIRGKRKGKTKKM